MNDKIKETDLRINSHYFFCYKITKVDLRIMAILCLKGENATDDLQGIPLIPSMLDMAEFAEHPEQIFIDKSDRFVIRFWPTGEIHIALKRAGNRVILPDMILTEIQYLHELQNLYYFLTREELKIEL